MITRTRQGLDPADTEWICFDVDIQSTVYILYDSRVEDGAEPAWLTANFADQHAEVAEAMTVTWVASRSGTAT